MTCTKIQNGFLCNLSTEHEVFLYLEHTTYLMEFSKRFRPNFFRIECGNEIEVSVEFNDNNEPTSNKFLWDFFDEWCEKNRR